MKLRPVTPEDVPAIHEFIVQLASFEHAASMVKMTVDQLRDALFADTPRAEGLIVDSADGEIGFALWYETLNPWANRPSMYIEDIFVNESARGKGAGQLILRHLAALALTRGYQRIEWSALTWNLSSINFYQKLGAEQLTDWTRFRMSEQALRLAVVQGLGNGG